MLKVPTMVAPLRCMRRFWDAMWMAAVALAVPTVGAANASAHRIATAKDAVGVPSLAANTGSSSLSPAGALVLLGLGALHRRFRR